MTRFGVLAVAVVLTASAALGGASGAEVSGAPPIPHSDVLRMKAVFSPVYLPGWLPTGLIYLDWKPIRAASNQTVSYDGVTLEFGSHGNVIDWTVTALRGICARQWDGGPLVPLAKAYETTTIAGKHYRQIRFGITAWQRFGQRTAYYVPGNHNQIAWSCVGGTLVTVVISDPGVLPWMRAAASAERA